jgi:hypothetical protein
MKNAAKLCKEIGIPVRDLDPMDAHLASGAIIRGLNGRNPDDLKPAELASVREAGYRAIVPAKK